MSPEWLPISQEPSPTQSFPSAQGPPEQPGGAWRSPWARDAPETPRLNFELRGEDLGESQGSCAGGPAPRPCAIRGSPPPAEAGAGMTHLMENFQQVPKPWRCISVLPHEGTEVVFTEHGHRAALGII